MNRIYSASTSGGATSEALAAFDPLLPGDIIKGIELNAGLQSSGADVGADFYMRAFLCNSKPRTVAEAAQGEQIMTTTRMIFETGGTIDGTTRELYLTLRQRLPCNVEIQKARYLAVLMTENSSGFSASLFLDIERKR